MCAAEWHRSEVTSLHSGGYPNLLVRAAEWNMFLDYSAFVPVIRHLVICQIVLAHQLSCVVHWVLEAHFCVSACILEKKRGSGLECRGVFSLGIRCDI